ncbi:MAG: 4-(cytidine 5'-diphospho)-2-C-methyl-D-erythritol kinase [Kosmotogaceae bacterium]|nr:4-(cytidine 5'-diphospho)-2-C-methyl-D-erythritol kinase [Kosmotogaceae bacterium]
MVSSRLGISSVSLKCPAKINLYLAVDKRRSDGFHNISTVFQTINFFDELILTPGVSETYFKCNTDLSWNHKNTLHKVLAEVERQTGRKIEIGIELKKRIPSGGGLGGGSSDAASLLRFFAQAFEIETERVIEMASAVGSDVPFFLRGGTAIASGRGEILCYPGDLTGYSVDLSFPEVEVSTVMAYRLIDEGNFFPGIDERGAEQYYKALKAHDSLGIKNLSLNSFQNTIFSRFAEIKEHYSKSSLEKPNAVVTMMTGSGSTIFSLFQGRIGKYRFISSEELNRVWYSTG